MENHEKESQQTMYDGRDEFYEDSRKSGRRSRKTTVILLILAGLVFSYLVRNGLWLLAMQQSLSGQPGCHLVTRFDWLTPTRHIKDQLLNEARLSNQNLNVMLLIPRLERIHLYYFSKQNEVFADLGFISIWTHAGINEIILYGPDIFRQSWYGSHRYTYFGRTLLDPLFKTYRGWLEKRHSKDRQTVEQPPFVITPYSQSLYFRIIFSIYLLVPLLIITFMVLRIGKVMYIALLYYVGMALLFNVKNLFYSSTFGWLFSRLKFNPPDFFPILFIILLFLLIAFLVYRGFQSIYREKLSFEKIMYILFFILLPLVLRM